MYFILYGALQVTYKYAGNIVCDIVRGGNVIGEEGLFEQELKYVETIQCCSKECVMFKLKTSDLM